MLHVSALTGHHSFSRTSFYVYFYTKSDDRPLGPKHVSCWEQNIIYLKICICLGCCFKFIVIYELQNCYTLNMSSVKICVIHYGKDILCKLLARHRSHNYLNRESKLINSCCAGEFFPALV